jgi:hypothetical protein
MAQSMLAVVLLLAAAGALPWRPAGEHDGIVVEQRPVTGSAILEVRASGRSPAPPAAVLETVWNHAEYEEFVPYLKRLDILAAGPDWLLVYEQVAMPLVRDRDYTIRLRRRVPAEAGRLEVTFESAPDEGPPENDAHVRSRSIEGSWLIEPAAGGGSLAAYTVRSDPGGALPAWVVNRLQARVMGRFVGAMLRRAETRRR